MIRTLRLLLVTAALAGAAGPALGQASEPAGPVHRVGVYHNADYGFRVAMPAGTRYAMAPAPSSNHGFFVPLASGDTLRVFTAYTDSSTLGGVVRELAPPGCVRASERPARLGGLEAREVVYRCGTGPRATEVRTVAARRHTILYEVSVQRPGGVSAAGERLFAAARAGFTLTSRRHG